MLCLDTAIFVLTLFKMFGLGHAVGSRGLYQVFFRDGESISDGIYYNFGDTVKCGLQVPYITRECRQPTAWIFV